MCLVKVILRSKHTQTSRLLQSSYYLKFEQLNVALAHKLLGEVNFNLGGSTINGVICY